MSITLESLTNIETLGRVSLEPFRSSIRLRWRYNKKQYTLTIGSNNAATIQLARVRANEINNDLDQDMFDISLQKYKHLGLIQNDTHLILSDTQPKTDKLPLRELWNQFVENKKNSGLKAKTLEEYRKFDQILDKLPRLNFNALEVKSDLLKVTTKPQSRRVLTYLNACCNWGLRHELCTKNPFNGVADELGTRSSSLADEPRAFTREEISAILDRFDSSKPYRQYKNLFIFWILTGCRPSEGIGLTWGNVAKDFSSIRFTGSIQSINGKQVRSEGSKNNKVRKIQVA